MLCVVDVKWQDKRDNIRCLSAKIRTWHSRDKWLIHVHVDKRVNALKLKFSHSQFGKDFHIKKLNRTRETVEYHLITIYFNQFKSVRNKNYVWVYLIHCCHKPVPYLRNLMLEVWDALPKLICASRITPLSYLVSLCCYRKDEFAL